MTASRPARPLAPRVEVARAHGARTDRAGRPGRAPRSGRRSWPGWPTSWSASQTAEPFFGVGKSYTRLRPDVRRGGRGLPRTRSATAGAVRCAATRRRRGSTSLRRPTSRSPHGAGVVATGGHLTVPETSCGRRRLRPRQWEQPPQPSQPLRRLGPQRRRARDVALRSAHHRTRSTTGPTSFDIELLARRLLDVTAWLQDPARAEHLADRLLRCQHRRRRGLVGRGRRLERRHRRHRRPAAAARTWPPSASTAVRAPTLLIVGGRDETVLELNRQARARLRCESQLVVVPGATHLFEEPGSLETVAALATGWFLDHLVPPVRAVPS